MAKGVHVTGVDLTDSDGNVDVTYNVGDNTFTFTASVSPTDVSAAGSDRQVQFNDAGNLGATSNLTFTEDPSTLGVKYGEFGDPEKNQNPDSFGENIIFTDAYFLNQETDVNGVNGFVEHDFNSSAPTGDRTLTGVSGFASAYRENSEDSGTDLGGFEMIGGNFSTGLPDAHMQRSQALRAQSRTNGSSIDYVTGVTSNVEVVATDVTELKGVEAAISADFSSETDVDRAYGVWVGYAVDTFDFNNDYPNNREDGVDNADRFYGIYVDFEKHSTFKGSLSAGYDPDNPSSPEATLTAKPDESGESVAALDGSLLVKSFNSNTGQYETVFEINEDGDIVEGNIDVSNVDVTAAGTDTQVQYNDAGSFGASSDFTWDGSILSVLTLNLANNKTADTSGDLQIRDDSTGDLFSLDDGNSPQLTAKYEGNGSFTFGSRTASVVGDNSIVIGKENEASAGSSTAIGSSNTASGFGSTALGEGSTASGGASSVAMGDGVVSDGESSVAMGSGTEANGAQSTSMGVGSVANEFASVAMGFNATSGGATSVSLGRYTTAAADHSVALGNRTVSRSIGKAVLGLWNADDLGSGNEVNKISDLSGDSKIFSVGAGEQPTASAGDSDYFDGRGRVDGLYVTMRNGTYVRHGLQVDKYDTNTGQYEPQFEVRDDGRLELYDPGQGVVLRSPNGTRHEIYVEDDGTIVSEEL